VGVVPRISGPRLHARGKTARPMNNHLIFIGITCRPIYC
jgi:hypothetical protein